MVELLPEAEVELLEAAVYYDEQQPGLGDRFLLQVRHALHRIADAPESWPPYQGALGASGVRFVRVRPFRHLLIYLVHDGPVVLAVAHASRAPGYWADRVP